MAVCSAHADIQSAFRRRHASELLGNVRRIAQHRSEYKHRPSPERYQPRCIRSSSSNPSSLVLYFLALRFGPERLPTGAHICGLSNTNPTHNYRHGARTCAIGITRAQAGGATRRGLPQRIHAPAEPAQGADSAPSGEHAVTGDTIMRQQLGDTASDPLQPIRAQPAIRRAPWRERRPTCLIRRT